MAARQARLASSKARSRGRLRSRDAVCQIEACAREDWKMIKRLLRSSKRVFATILLGTLCAAAHVHAGEPKRCPQFDAFRKEFNAAKTPADMAKVGDRHTGARMTAWSDARMRELEKLEDRGKRIRAERDPVMICLEKLDDVAELVATASDKRGEVTARQCAHAARVLRTNERLRTDAAMRAHWSWPYLKRVCSQFPQALTGGAESQSRYPWLAWLLG